MTDQGPQPFVVDIEKATVNNPHFRNTLWTGSFLQLTVMTISPGEDIGAEIHEDHDQFLRIEEGKAQVMIGAAENDLVVPHRHRRRQNDHRPPALPHLKQKHYQRPGSASGNLRHPPRPYLRATRMGHHGPRGPRFLQ